MLFTFKLKDPLKWLGILNENVFKCNKSGSCGDIFEIDMSYAT